MQEIVAPCDLKTIEECLQDDCPRTDQFAADCSQNSFKALISNQDTVVPDYTKTANPVMTSDNRALLVKQITDLYKEKKYKNETLHLAVSIADRFLALCAEKGKRSPFAATLAVVAMLMAAKLEQPISPSFSRMITLLPED